LGFIEPATHLDVLRALPGEEEGDGSRDSFVSFVHHSASSCVAAQLHRLILIVF
jgi:hypothetical protein